MPLGYYNNVECKTWHKKFSPQEHQQYVKNWFLKTPYKGLLLFHRLGSGKTCSSIIIGDALLKGKFGVDKVYILTPGSLRQGWINEYCGVCGNKAELLKKKYIFLTYNYTVYKQLQNISEDGNIFNNSLVIIDEVHNFINNVKNKTKNAVYIYKKLVESNCKILALSGTPIYNDISEWGLLGNLLKPGAFPTNFKDLFVINDDKLILQNNNFIESLQGIVSYFPGIEGQYYPIVIEEPIVKTEMTLEQYSAYLNEFNNENEFIAITSWKISKGKPLSIKEKQLYILATKRIQSKAISNFHYPYLSKDGSGFCKCPSLEEIPVYGIDFKEIIDPKNPKTKKPVVCKCNKKPEMCRCLPEYEKKPMGLRTCLKCNPLNSINAKKEPDFLKPKGWVSREYFNNKELINIYSRKFAELFRNILNNYNSKHMVFSFYKEKSGLYMIKALCDMCGIPAKLFTGELNDKQRKKILEEFNSPKNRYGEQIKIILVSDAGAEGITLLETGHVHILESDLRENKIQQVIGRVVRYKSHYFMPPELQKVHIWRYWSIPPTSDTNKDFNKKKCVDEILYEKGMKKLNVLNNFIELLIENSIENMKN
jgi:superfamily II DNA or RNA helicase